jgi:rubrerythrin
MEALVSLSRLAEKLNQTTDAYTQSLTALEKQLREMNIGIEIWLEINETAKSGSPSRETSLRKLLGYARLTEGWSLAVKTVRVERGYMADDAQTPWENVYEEEAAKALLKASREQRIEAAEHVPKLLEQLEARMTELIRSVEQADARLRDFGRPPSPSHPKPEPQWKCDSCGEVLRSPRDRCRCPVIRTAERAEINPPRHNIAGRKQ